MSEILNQEIEDMVGEMYEDEYTIKTIIERVFKCFNVTISKSKIYKIVRKRNS